MEKSEFHVLIKHCFLMGKNILFKQSNGLISVIRTLLCQKQQLRGGMLTINAVVQIQIMLNAQVAQIQQLSQKTQKKLHKLVLADYKLKLHKIAKGLQIWEGSVFTILYEHLSMRKLWSKWVPCLLTIKNSNFSRSRWKQFIQVVKQTGGHTNEEKKDYSASKRWTWLLTPSTKNIFSSSYFSI